MDADFKGDVPLKGNHTAQVTCQKTIQLCGFLPNEETNNSE